MSSNMETRFLCLFAQLNLDTFSSFHHMQCFPFSLSHSLLLLLGKPASAPLEWGWIYTVCALVMNLLCNSKLSCSHISVFMLQYRGNVSQWHKTIPKTTSHRPRRGASSSIKSDSLYPNQRLVCSVETFKMPRTIISCVGWAKTGKKYSIHVESIRSKPNQLPIEPAL